MQDPDPQRTPRAAFKTMTVQFTDGTEETVRQGTVYTNFERGWTTVVAPEVEEIVLRMPSRLIASFQISA